MACCSRCWTLPPPARSTPRSPRGRATPPSDLTVKFLRPATEASGRLRAVGRVVSRGRRTALAEAQLVDEAGRLVAHATSSCMIFAA
ncbi:PaaI family thioesterase [uncultured Nocardioides sp.]|uniref:PaaI family thioesterase n=1 Tax=uncultured Nocardioides sp. TaxID=198441 RepID=UPI00342CE413